MLFIRALKTGLSIITWQTNATTSDGHFSCKITDQRLNDIPGKTAMFEYLRLLPNFLSLLFRHGPLSALTLSLVFLFFPAENEFKIFFFEGTVPPPLAFWRYYYDLHLLTTLIWKLYVKSHTDVQIPFSRCANFKNLGAKRRNAPSCVGCPSQVQRCPTRIILPIDEISSNVWIATPIWASKLI